MLKIDKEGLAIVEISSKEEEMLLGVALAAILKRMPNLELLIVGIRTGKIDTAKDFGITTGAKEIGKYEDIDKAVKMLKDEQPVDNEDIPDFVKRSLEGEIDE